MLKDIYPGTASSNPQFLTNMNNALFFAPTDSLNGYELWTYLLNDECQDALEVDVDQTYYGSNFGATGDDITSCAFNDVIDVWYCFRPPSAGQYTITAGSDEIDTTLAVFDACGGNQLDCNDDYYLTTDSQIVLDMIKGKKYYIRVAGFDGQEGNYELTVTAGACTEWAPADINYDCKVDFQDFALMASEWLTCNINPPELCWE
jgi:hypothetical protein